MSQVFAEAAVIELLDGLACALLAAAATCRARNFGAHFTGAVTLGCLCGLIGPLTRELVLHGQTGASLVVGALPDNALIGALAAVCAGTMLGRFQGKLFFWLDSASCGLAASLGACLALPGLGMAGALTLGLITAYSPGLCRDIALGDTAMLVESDWYATAGAIGCVIALALLILPGRVSWVPEILVERGGEIASISGAVAVMAIRYLRWRKNPD